MTREAARRLTLVGLILAALLLLAPGRAAAGNFAFGGHRAIPHGFGHHHSRGFFAPDDLNRRQSAALRHRFGGAIHQVHPHGFLSGHTLVGPPATDHGHGVPPHGFHHGFDSGHRVIIIIGH